MNGEAARILQWDPIKEARVRRERGIVRADVERAFRDPFRYEVFDDREDYGEDRYIVTGHTGTKLVTFVYTERGDTIRIITAWRATKAEAEDYEAGI